MPGDKEKGQNGLLHQVKVIKLHPCYFFFKSTMGNLFTASNIAPPFIYLLIGLFFLCCRNSLHTPGPLEGQLSYYHLQLGNGHGINQLKTENVSFLMF